MLVDMFVATGTVGLSGNPLVDFRQGAAVDLPDGRRARVVSVLSIENVGLGAALRGADRQTRLTWE